jgi:type 1 glutamine amidotransferase
MRKVRVCLILMVAFGALSTVHSQAKKKKLLAIGEVKGWQHDSVSHAFATIEKLGYDSGLWDTYIRTDCQLVTKKKVPAGNAKNLDYFDAVAFYTTGELDMDDSQKADLLSFVRDDGKGFIGIHSAPDTFYKWPEYGEMLGGYFDEHPWLTFDAPVIVEDRSFPGMNAFPPTFTIHDEIYQLKNWSREKSRVLMRLDPNQIDLKNPRVHRTDKDFAVAYAKMYGKGRVFYSTLGHVTENWDRKDVQTMYVEAIKWAMGTEPGDATPRPMPAGQ